MLGRVIFLFVCGLPAVAAADPAAEKLFEDGRSALAAGNLDEACEDFHRSDVLEPRVGTLLNLADCDQRRGKLATAWSEFVDAQARAQRVGDPRAAEAGKRAAALAPRLAYLTIVVAADMRGAGVTVRRNGTAIDPAAWDRKLPADPGTYTFDAEARDHVPWHHELVLAEQQDARVEVPSLAAVPRDPTSTPAPAHPGIVATPPATAAPIAGPHVGIGLLTGLSSDLDWINGARIVLNAAPLGPGVLRVVPSVMYASSTDPSSADHTIKTWALGGTLEYAYPVTQRLVAAGGVGFGVDILKDSWENAATKYGWGAVRLSPTLRFGSLDIGGHVQFVATSSRIVTLFELGLDYFVW